MRRLPLVLACLLLVSLVLADPPKVPRPAPKPKPAAASHSDKWTVDDVIKNEAAGDFQIAPDGRHAVWVKTALDSDKDEHVSQLMRTELANQRTIELTRGPDSCVSPRWSPDGKTLAFLSSRPAPKTKTDKGRRAGRDKADDEDKQQVWLLDPFGGEPWRLTDFTRGVNSFEWAGSKTIVFSAQEEASRRENELKDDKKDKTQVVEDEKHEPPVRLFQIAVKGKTTVRLTDNKDRIETLAVSPDGKKVVAIHSRSLRYVYDNKVKPMVYLHNLESGARKQVFKDPQLNLSSVRWSPDGKAIYASNEYSSQPQFAVAGVTELYYLDLAADRTEKVDLQWDRGLSEQWENPPAQGFLPTADGFIALLANGVRSKLARYTRQDGKWRRDWLQGEGLEHLFGLQLGRDGKTLLYSSSTASKPTQWFRAELDGVKVGKGKAITELNEHLAERKMARTEVVRWKGANDEEVEGILYYPHDYKAERKYPLVVLIHGGPASLDLDSWDESWAYAANLYCQRGAFVLKPNYHGSSHYGLKWLESISRGKYLDLETVDIERGVDHLIGKGLADPAKLGLMGWSNGAILTNALTVRTTRYKAAVAGAGTIEYVSDWANCEFGDSFDRYYLGRTPLQDPKLYHEKSPFYQLDKVRTPTLILFGTEDRVVPTEQGWVHYRGLQQLGKTEVRFVLFPGERHSLKKPVHQRRKLTEELAWFDRHLFGALKEENEALKPASPLAWALKRRAARQDGGRFGVLEKGVLIPETVSYKGLQVGRFEVTAAQFAAFDKEHKVEPGRENYPAAGISFEKARAYCDWLSRTTGRTIRLPTDEEADDLYGKSETGDNTLDAWAGYAVNPDDAGRLREKSKELPGPAPLLRAVGSGRGVVEGEGELVFDLGGNVAEWTTGPDGKGVLKGGSADTPASPLRPTSPAAAPEYRGFRVVREEKETK